MFFKKGKKKPKSQEKSQKHFFFRKNLKLLKKIKRKNPIPLVFFPVNPVSESRGGGPLSVTEHARTEILICNIRCQPNKRDYQLCCFNKCNKLL